MANRTLPEFKKPPVVEILLGVQFEPLNELSSAHLGLFWNQVRDRYPQCIVQPPLPEVFETFPDASDSGHWPADNPSLEVQRIAGPDIRYWYVGATKTRLIQLQRGRFVHNWRQVTGEETYPRYDTIKQRFKEDWQSVKEFLVDENLGTPQVNQCEMTYINRLEAGKGWNSFGDLENVVNYWRAEVPSDFLPKLENAEITCRYVMPDAKGRLHISIEPGMTRKTKKKSLKLDLTARGRPRSSDIGDIEAWFELAHAWIVRGFTDFTTKNMHSIWKRTL